MHAPPSPAFGGDSYVPLALAGTARPGDAVPAAALLAEHAGSGDHHVAASPAHFGRWPRWTRRASVVGLGVAGLLVAAIAATAPHGNRRAIVQTFRTVGLKEEKCHTAEEGEPCFQEVQYQQDHIKKHPAWFPDLTPESTFEEVQESLYKQVRCPKPCKAAGGKAPTDEEAEPEAEEEEPEAEEEEPEAEEEEPEAEEEEPEAEEEAEPEKEAEEEEEPSDECHTTVDGEKCFSSVKWVLKEGIFSKPKWYEGLTRMSRIEEVQARLHKNDPGAKCPRPCKCKTAENGDKCHKRVLWVMLTGVHQHPDWYKGLSIASRFEAVQERLHEDHNSGCSKPCTPMPYLSPSLFCVTVTRPDGYEPVILREANRRSIGLFDCDEYAAYSTSSIDLGAGFQTIPFVMATVGKSKDGTAGNALLFMNVWTAVKNDFRSKNLDWTVKIDADAILLPDRLRNHVNKHNAESVYIKNCGAYDAPGWPKLFGALEVYSRKAMLAYFNGEGKCKTDLDWYTWGEDLYMERCMDHLGVDSLVDLKIASDGACLPAPNCKDGWAAAIHPFKSWEKWHECFVTTIR